MLLLRVLRVLVVLLFGLRGQRLSIANVREGALQEVWFTLALPAAFFVFSPNFFGIAGMILVGMMKLIGQTPLHKGRAIYVLTILWPSLRFHPFYPLPQYHQYHNIISQSMPSYPSSESSH